MKLNDTLKSKLEYKSSKLDSQATTSAKVGSYADMTDDDESGAAELRYKRNKVSF